MAKKVIANCVKIVEKEGVVQRQSYKRVSKQLLRSAYFGHHPRRQKTARIARKKLRTIGKRVLRELEIKLPERVLEDYRELFGIYLKALTQEKTTKDKVYSLHEPQVACIAKGKSGKNYEFGTKVAVVRGWKTGVITSVKRFYDNPHDSEKLEESLAQSERVRKSVGETRPKKVATDPGFRGIKEVEGTAIFIPPKKEKTRYGQHARLRFRARVAIESYLSHLKRNHSLGLNFLKEVAGDINNALLAGIEYNLKMRLNQIKQQILLWLEIVLRSFLCKYNFQNQKLDF